MNTHITFNRDYDKVHQVSKFYHDENCYMPEYLIITKPIKPNKHYKRQMLVMTRVHLIDFPMDFPMDFPIGYCFDDEDMPF